MIQKRFTVVHASFGDIFITAEDDHIVTIGMTRPHVLSAMRQDDAPLLVESAQQLRRYLDGNLTALSLPLSESPMPFTAAVYHAVRAIPYGEQCCAEDIAAVLEKPHAVKAVESVCRGNPFRIAIPTHRVKLSGHEPPRKSRVLMPDDALCLLEKRYLDKEFKRR